MKLNHVLLTQNNYCCHCRYRTVNITTNWSTFPYDRFIFQKNNNLMRKGHYRALNLWSLKHKAKILTGHCITTKYKSQYDILNEPAVCFVVEHHDSSCMLTLSLQISREIVIGVSHMLSQQSQIVPCQLAAPLGWSITLYTLIVGSHKWQYMYGLKTKHEGLNHKGPRAWFLTDLENGPHPCSYIKKPIVVMLYRDLYALLIFKMADWWWGIFVVVWRQR